MYYISLPGGVRMPKYTADEQSAIDAAKAAYASDPALQALYPTGSYSDGVSAYLREEIHPSFSGYDTNASNNMYKDDYVDPAIHRQEVIDYQKENYPSIFGSRRTGGTDDGYMYDKYGNRVDEYGNIIGEQTTGGPGGPVEQNPNLPGTGGNPNNTIPEDHTPGGPGGPPPPPGGGTPPPPYVPSPYDPLGGGTTGSVFTPGAPGWNPQGTGSFSAFRDPNRPMAGSSLAPPMGVMGGMPPPGTGGKGGNLGQPHLGQPPPSHRQPTMGHFGGKGGQFKPPSQQQMLMDTLSGMITQEPKK